MEHPRRTHRRLTVVLALVLALTALAATTAGTLARDARGGKSGAVYTLSNAASGNEVIVFDRARDGSLSLRDSYATDGLGSGGGLGSQGAVVLSDDGRWLLAVNAGSDEITAFRVTGRGLHRTATVYSGGDTPISVTIDGNVVYALNAGGAGNISGFKLDRNGRLHALPHTTMPLSGAGVGPAQVEFTPDGKQLVVTEKNSNKISTYQVDHHGMAHGPVVNDSAGVTPFGFAFNNHGTLIVSEAAGGAVNASSTSSYRVNADGSLTVLSAAVLTTQTAACWVAISENGRHAYIANTGSGSVSGYAVMRNGSIALQNATAGLTGQGSAPIDVAVAGSYLYSLGSGSDAITVFKINADGSLTNMGAVSGLPASTVGLAAD